MQSKAPAGVLFLLIAAFSLALVHVPLCTAHGFLASPRSRATALGKADWEAAGGNGLGTRPFRTYQDGRNMNDQADVCGDPHQDVGNMDLRNKITPILATGTYSQGQVIDVSTRITVNHGGWIGVSICTSARSGSGLSQACFDSQKLVNTATGTTRWWIQTGEYGKVSVYQTQWRLPANLNCNGGCVLQMTYKTANSCVDSCTQAECGSAYAARNNPIKNIGWGPYDRCFGYPGAYGEVFRDCADIKITSSGGSSGGSSVSSCASISGYTVFVGKDYAGSDISCMDGNDINTAAAECNKNSNCKSFILTVSGSWLGRCMKTVAKPATSASNVCFYSKQSSTSTACTKVVAAGGQCGSNYGCCPSGQCCSQYGYCGITSAHCSSGCQKSYGYCT